MLAMTDLEHVSATNRTKTLCSCQAYKKSCITHSSLLFRTTSRLTDGDCRHCLLFAPVQQEVLVGRNCPGWATLPGWVGQAFTAHPYQTSLARCLALSSHHHTKLQGTAARLSPLQQKSSPNGVMLPSAVGDCG